MLLDYGADSLSDGNYNRLKFWIEISAIADKNR